MRIGVSSSCFYPMQTEKALKKLGEMNVSVCEIFINSFDELQGEILKEIIKIINYYSIEVKSVHPMTSGYEPYLFFGAYPRRVNFCIDLYKKYFEFCEKIGANILNFHGDRYGQNRCDINEYCDIYNRLYEAALEYNVIFSQENVSKCKSRDVKFIKDMRRILGDDVNFTLDLKQAYRSGVNPLDMAEAMGDKLCHLHLNDFDKNYDCLLPFSGEYDIINIFNYLYKSKHDIDLIIEVYRESYKEYHDIKNSFDISKHKLAEFLNQKEKQI